MSTPKASEPSEAAPDLNILGDQIVIHPPGYVESPATQNEAQEQNLTAHVVRFRESPLEFLREVSLHVSVQDGGPTTKSLDSQSSIPASARI